MQTERTITERTTSAGDGNAKALSAQEYLHGLMAAVITPLLVAAVTGFLVGALAFAIALKGGALDAWVTGLIWWLVTTLLVWILKQAQLFLLISLEKMTGIDINGDGVIGKPGQRTKAAEPWNVKVTLREVHANGHWSGNSTKIELLGSPAAIAMFATAMLGGTSMAERLWCGDGKPFSQDDFRENRKTLIKNRLIELKNPKDERQGFQLTVNGIQAMQDVRDQYAERVSPPPPGEDA